jgi:hypothetical protein
MVALVLLAGTDKECTTLFQRVKDGSIAETAASDGCLLLSEDLICLM